MSTKPLGGRRKVPHGWRPVTLDDIKSRDPDACRAGPFGSSISRKYFVEVGVPVIRGNNLSTNLTEFVAEDFAFVTEQRTRDKYKNCLVRPGDLVFTCWGTIGQVGRIPDDGPFDEYVISNKQLKLRTDPSIANSKFVYYYVASKAGVNYIKSRSIGAAVPGINLGIMKSIPIALPPMTLQESIVGILSAYDDLIENNRRRIQLLEQAARLLYKEWFVHLRFPGHEHSNFTKGIPEGWQRVPLQKVCNRITDGSHSSPQSVDEGLPMASVKDMHDWGFNTDQCRKVGQQDFELLVRNDCKPLKNDVLIAKGGSYLKHTFVVQEEIDLVILSSIAMLRPNHLIDPHLLNFILRDPRTKMRMAGYVSGVALPRIILKEFRDFEILLPPIELQRIWAIHANPIAIQCHKLGKQNETLVKARDLLLPRLMNGEVEV